MEGIIGVKGEGFSGTNIKDTWTITRRGRNRGGGSVGGVGRGGGKRQKTVLEQQVKTRN